MAKTLSGTTTTESGLSQFEIIRQAADDYMNGHKELNITAQELGRRIGDTSGLSLSELEFYNPCLFSRGPFIIDIRTPDAEMPDFYYMGHIPGAVNIPWRQIITWRTLKELPRDRQVVICSSTGQTGGQAAAVFNLLGFDAVNLKWGMTAWTSNEEIAPGRYNRGRDTVWHEGGGYRTVQTRKEPGETCILPTVNNINSNDRATVIMAAAAAYLGHGKPVNISAPELYRMMYFEDETENLYSGYNSSFSGIGTPFMVDIREDEVYNHGHIPGCLHVHPENLFTEENLSKLPTDRLVVVCSNTGHSGGHIAALLSLLGYMAVNLRWGITAWSLSLPGADIAPSRFSPESDCRNYPIVKGYNLATPCHG